MKTVWTRVWPKRCSYKKTHRRGRLHPSPCKTGLVWGPRRLYYMILVDPCGTAVPGGVPAL